MKKILLDTPLVGTWVAEKLGSQWVPGPTVAIGLVDIAENGTERIIAGALFSDYNQASMQVHLAAEEGARWMTKAFLGFSFQYAFNQARVKKLLGFVGSGNKAAQRFDEHIGFKLETVIEDAHPDGHLIIYSMTREQCRWLSIHVPREAIYGQEFRTTCT